MHMVPHDNIAVKLVMAERMLSILNGFDDQIRNLCPAKVKRAGTCIVEHAIQGQESSSGACRGGEAAAGGKAVSQSLCEKHWSARRMIVRQTARMKGHHQNRVGS
jgi:hypothetical protein